MEKQVKRPRAWNPWELSDCGATKSGAAIGREAVRILGHRKPDWHMEPYPTALYWAGCMMIVIGKRSFVDEYRQHRDRLACELTRGAEANRWGPSLTRHKLPREHAATWKRAVRELLARPVSINKRRAA